MHYRYSGLSWDVPRPRFDGVRHDISAPKFSRVLLVLLVVIGLEREAKEEAAAWRATEASGRSRWEQNGVPIYVYKYLYQYMFSARVFSMSLFFLWRELIRIDPIASDFFVPKSAPQH